MKRTRIFFLLFAICIVLAACAVQKPETTTPVADTTTAEPGTTSAAEPATEPAPAALPEFEADGIIVLPEGELLGLFRYSSEYAMEKEIGELVSLLSGAPIEGTQDSDGPWTTVAFTLGEQETASFAVSKDNVLRYTSGAKTIFCRLADGADISGKILAFYEKNTGSVKDQEHYPKLETYVSQKAEEYRREGKAAWLDACSNVFLYPVSSEYTYMVYLAQFRMLPEMPEPGQLLSSPWQEKEEYIPLLLDIRNDAFIELDKKFLLANSFTPDEMEKAFLSALRTDKQYGHILNDAYPFFWMQHIISLGGKARLVTLDETANDYPAFPVYVHTAYLGRYFRWIPCDRPAFDGRFGVAFESPDGSMRITVYEGDYIHVQQPGQDVWLLARLDPFATGEETVLTDESLYAILRRNYDQEESSPLRLVLKSSTNDPQQAALEFLALWGEHLQKNLSPGNVYAVSEFSYKKWDPGIVSVPAEGAKIHAVYISYSLRPKNEAGYTVWPQGSLGSDGVIHHFGTISVEKTAESEWRCRGITYGAGT